MLSENLGSICDQASSGSVVKATQVQAKLSLAHALYEGFPILKISGSKAAANIAYSVTKAVRLQPAHPVLRAEAGQCIGSPDRHTAIGWQ